MRTILVFCMLLCGIQTSTAQITKIRSAKVSHDKSLIAFICFLKSNQDIFIYNIEVDSLQRLTTSESLNFDEQYKTSPNWIDNSILLFLSKHSGKVQQYLLDIKRGDLSSHSSSESDEYSLSYSPINKQTYYTSSIGGKEPAILTRGLISNTHSSVTSKNINYGFSDLSIDYKYLAFYELPRKTPHIYSIIEEKIIETKLPKSNVTILSWSADSQNLLYKHTKFSNGKPMTSLYIYNIDTKTSTILLKNRNAMRSAILMSDAKKYIYTTDAKMYIVDIETKDIEEHNIKGDLDSWIKDNTSLLIIDNDKAFIYDIQNKETKSIIN